MTRRGNPNAAEAIDRAVARMQELLNRHRLFDVLGLMRFTEIPMTLDGTNESEVEYLPAALELVALVGLSSDAALRPMSQEPSEESLESVWEDVIELRQVARSIIQTALEHTLDSDDADPLAVLGSAIKSLEITMRNRQYDSIATPWHAELFGAHQIRGHLGRSAGFDHEELQVFVQALKARFHENMSAVAGALNRADEVQADPGSSNDDLRRAFDDVERVFRAPALPSLFTIDDLVATGPLPREKLVLLLDRFAVEPFTEDARTLAGQLLRGFNAVNRRGIVHDGAGTYLLLTEPIPNDVLRTTLESVLKTVPKAWTSYARHRASWTEQKAMTLIAGLLHAPDPPIQQLKYYAAKIGHEADLGENCQDPGRAGLLVEADGLFVLDDVAVCVEVKAGSLTDRGRQGDPDRLIRDLRTSVGHAAHQAERLRRLIVRNRGLWNADGSWLDLSAVREVYTVVVCLDEFGPLGIAVDALIRAGVLDGDSVPWIVSLHDLAVIAAVMRGPASFVLYLSRRSDPATARMFEANDELDVFMWFLEGGLRFEADPELLHRLHPQGPAPTAQARRSFARQRATRIGTFTDPLDAWMYHRAGLAGPAPKPERYSAPLLDAIAAHLQRGHQPGWLSASIRLMSLPVAVQHELMEQVATELNDPDLERAIAFAGMEWSAMDGFHALVVGVTGNPSRSTLELFEARAQQWRYKHRHTTLLAVLIHSRDGTVIQTFCLNMPWQPDPVLAAAMDNVPPLVQRTQKPPYATRRRRRLR